MLDEYVLQNIIGYCDEITVKKLVQTNKQIRKIIKRHYKHMLQTKLYTIVKMTNDKSISIYGLYETIDIAKKEMIKKYVNDKLHTYRCDSMFIIEELECDELKIPNLDTDDMLLKINKFDDDTYTKYFDDVLKKPLKKIIMERTQELLAHSAEKIKTKFYGGDIPITYIKESDEVIGVYEIYKN